MKRFGLALLVAVVAFGVAVPRADAIPVFKKKFDALYVENAENESFAEAAKEQKCNICHFGKTKKNKNDYGMALSKLLKKDNYKSSRVKAEADVVDKELEEAFKKVTEMKAVGGKTFGERLKAGELPGTEPPAEK